jgi:hypothetical protein
MEAGKPTFCEMECTRERNEGLEMMAFPKFKFLLP